MAQLRHDYERFKALNTEVLVIIPNGPKMIVQHVTKKNTPYPILTDKGAKVAAQYYQSQTLFKLGKPTVFLVGKTGRILYHLYSASWIDEPDNEEPLAVLATLAQQHSPGQERIRPL